MGTRTATVLVGTQSDDSLFEIPYDQVRFLVNASVDGVRSWVVFAPDFGDVYGYYVPSTGDYTLSAFFAAGSYELQLDLVGVAWSRPPVANAGEPQVTTAETGGNAYVTLDGSSSYDVDVEDEVVGIHWYEGSSYLGSGATLGVWFPVGLHTVTAVPFDGSGKWSQADTTVRVLPQP